MRCTTCEAEYPDDAPECPVCRALLDRTIGEVLGREAASTGAPPAPARKACAGEKPGVVARYLLCAVLESPVELVPGSFVRIGRDRTSDIWFPSSHVSRLHAEVVEEGGRWVIGDLGSKNGILVNGERVLRRVLADGDRIGIGEFELTYREFTAEELASRHVSADETARVGAEGEGFHGDLRKLSVVELTQLLSQNRKTGVLTIMPGPPIPDRSLHLLDGSIVHAQCDDLDGEKAALAVLGMRAGKFVFRPKPFVDKVTVSTPTSTLLMRAASEQRAGGTRAEPRGGR